MDASPKTALEKRLDTLREPFKEFITAQTTAGALLLLAMCLALLVYNLGERDWYLALRALPLGFHVGAHEVSFSLLSFTNDALIAVFFFLIGLEIKRELLAGELQSPARRRMLIASATGGMLIPALIYAAVNYGSPQGMIDGWGIPMATDTALAIGVLAAMGRRLVPGAAAFLVGLAIVDDIGAVTVIAIFYTDTIHMAALGSAAVLLVLGLFLNYAGVRHPLIYTLVGTLLWLAIHHSGVHASIAGVLIAATVPARPRVPPGWFQHRLQRRLNTIHPQADVLADPDHHEKIASMAEEAQAATTPLRRWERSLDLPVALIILPLFAFLNAGVPVHEHRLQIAMADPVALGIFAGLLLGKPVGILAAAGLANRLGFGHLPDNITVWHLIGLGLLAGIGFTMSTFIAGLALPEPRLESAKIAILAASLIAGLLGYTALRLASRPPRN